MKKYYISLLVLLIFTASGLLASPLRAEGQAGQEKRSNELRLLKIQIATLMLEKKQLEVQHNSLRLEYMQVKKEFADVMRDLISVDSNFLENSRTRLKHERIVEDLGLELDNIEDEYLIKKFKNAYLSRELIDEKELQSLRRLQLSQMLIQKRDLELDVKWLEYQRDEVEFEMKEEMLSLQKNLRKRIERAQELALMVNQIEMVEDLTPQKQALEKRRNQLSGKLEHMKEKLQVLEESRLLFEDKQELARRSLSVPIEKKSVQKQELQNVVSDLEVQYQSLSFVVQESFSREKRFQSLMEQMVDLDRENQILRRKISALESQLSSNK